MGSNIVSNSSAIHHRRLHSRLSLQSHDNSSHITHKTDSTLSHLPAGDWRIKHHPKSRNNPSKDLEMMRGFDSVREALLKTSNAIKDIDEIIEKREVKS